jgi:predicted cobalt transporter CbtA
MPVASLKLPPSVPQSVATPLAQRKAWVVERSHVAEHLLEFREDPP